jgi:hypothetical protein
MKTNVKSLASACGLTIVLFSCCTGPARAQGLSNFPTSGVPTGTSARGFAPLAGFYGGYGYPSMPAPVSFTNPPPVLVPKVLTSYVPSYEGIQPFYGSSFTGGAYRPYAYFYRPSFFYRP